MNHKALKTLEYNKIIGQLTEYASSSMGKELCSSLLPSIDYDEIVQSQQETTDAVSRIRMKGSLSFNGVRDIRDSLKRLEIGSSLGIIELLSISSVSYTHLDVYKRQIIYLYNHDIQFVIQTL